MRFVLFVLAAGVLASCGKKDSGSPSSTPGQGSGTETGTQTATAAGQLAFSIPSDVDPATIKVTVVGHQDADVKVAVADGKASVQGLQAGKQDLIVQAGSVGVQTLTESKLDRGVRLNKVEITDTGVVDLKELAIPKAGSAKGAAKLAAAALAEFGLDAAGIDVFIPGTGFIAKTDSEGAFLLDTLPVGTHNLFVEKDGYKRGVIAEFEVKSEQQTSLPEITLMVDSGISGAIVQLNDGASETTSATVSVTLFADDATLYACGESPTLDGIEWKPFVSSTSWTFSDTEPGTKTLFCKFSNANGLETTIVSDQIGLVSSVWAKSAKLGAACDRITTGAPIISGTKAYYLCTGKLAVYDVANDTWTSETLPSVSATDNILVSGGKLLKAEVSSGTATITKLEGGAFTSYTSTSIGSGCYVAATDDKVVIWGIDTGVLYVKSFDGTSWTTHTTPATGAMSASNFSPAGQIKAQDKQFVAGRGSKLFVINTDTSTGFVFDGSNVTAVDSGAPFSTITKPVFIDSIGTTLAVTSAAGNAKFLNSQTAVWTDSGMAAKSVTKVGSKFLFETTGTYTIYDPGTQAKDSLPLIGGQFSMSDGSHVAVGLDDIDHISRYTD